MKALSFVLLLLMSSTLLAEDVSPPALLGEHAQPGTLLFSKGDCLAVRVFTGSPYTHVAMICPEEGDLVVYDANPGDGVRRQSLDEYLKSIAPGELQLLQPRRPLTGDEQTRLQSYLTSKLRTPYSVMHHTTGHRADGVHCAEYLTDALMELQWIEAESPPRVSPGSLLQGLTAGKVYVSGASYQMEEPDVSTPVGRNSCEQLWLDTKSCCRKCCRQLSRWFLCR